MPLRKPRKGETQSDYMKYCVSEMMGDGKRPQEQAVAACLSTWRDAKGEKAPPGKDFPAALIAAWANVLAKVKADAKSDDDEDDKKPNGNGKDDEDNEDNAKKRPKFAKAYNVISPAAGESRESFMARCVKDITANGSVSEADARSSCEGTWNQFANMAKPTGQSAPAGGDATAKAAKVARIIARYKAKFGEQPAAAILKAITPDDDESREEFMDRCTENHDEDFCSDQWDEERGDDEDDDEERAAMKLVHKQHESHPVGMEFILSDATPDRFGDIVDPNGWDTKAFQKNPIALFNHHPDWIVGTWKGLRVKDNALRGHLTLAPKGTSARIDEIRALVEAGILKAVSVGFKPIESKPREGSHEHPLLGTVGGRVYTKSELVETSLVSIPANPNALAVAKSLHVSPETLRLVFREHAGNGTTGSASVSARRGAKHGSDLRRAITGEHAKTYRPVIRGQTMILSQRIETAEKHLVGLRDQLQEHLATVDDENPDDAAMVITEELTAKIGNAERNVANLKAAEARLASTNGGGDAREMRQEMTHTTALNQDHKIAERMIGNGPRPFGLAPKKINAMDYLIRQGVVEAYRKVKGLSVDDARQRIYGNDECTRAYVDYAQRAASAQAITTVTGWAAELVQQVYGDFLQILVPTSVMPNLANLGLALTFGRAGRIVIPSRSATPSLAGSFVGEGQAIPVRQGAFTTQTLTPKKLGVITSWTREMDEHSIPAIEGVLRDSVAIDTGIAIDNVLMDANAATLIRPAGLRSGVTGLTPTAGGGFNALVGDIKQLAGALLTATAGHIRSGTFLMNPQQALSISLTQPPAAATPLFPFTDEIAAGRLRSFRLIVSANVPLGMVIALDAADFVTVGAEAPRFEVSDQATLHFEDTAPTDITGGTPSPAVPVRSMFQTDSIALRLVWPLNWTLRRLGMVTWLTGVTW